MLAPLTHSLTRVFTSQMALRVQRITTAAKRAGIQFELLISMERLTTLGYTAAGTEKSRREALAASDEAHEEIYDLCVQMKSLRGELETLAALVAATPLLLRRSPLDRAADVSKRTMFCSQCGVPGHASENDVACDRNSKRGRDS